MGLVGFCEEESLLFEMSEELGESVRGRTIFDGSD